MTYLLFPLQYLQTYRWAILGYAVPVYYLGVILPVLFCALYALITAKKSKWEILWWVFPLACLGGIFWGEEPVWSLRQWTSWMARGAAAGGSLYLLAAKLPSSSKLIKTVYGAALLASLFGAYELLTHSNPMTDPYVPRSIPAVQQAALSAELRGPGSLTEAAENPFYRPYSNYTTSGRPMGTQGNRVPYISILLPFLPVGIWRWKHSRKNRALWMSSSLILFSVILLSQARSGWVGLITCMGIYVLLNFKENKRGTTCIFYGALAVLFLALIFPQTRQRVLTRVQSFNLRDQDIRHRLGSYPTVAALKGRWLFGAGYGNYPKVYQTHYTGPFPNLATPDNQYLRWLIETGIVGFGTLVLFLRGLVLAIWRRIRVLEGEDPEEGGFYKALLAGWAGIATTFLFFDGFYWGAPNITFWCFLGLAATCLKK